jgi:hypothetical protein
MTTKQITLLLSALVLIGALGWVGYLASVEMSDQAGPAAHEMEEPDEEHAELMARPKEASNGTARLVISMDPQAGSTVGTPVRFTARVTDTAGRPLTNVQFNVAFNHVEDDKIVFATRAVAPDGILTWEFAPFDGVPYEVRVQAGPTTTSSSQFGIVQASPVVFVEALAPPLRVKILNTIYLVAVVGLGVATGLWAAFRRAARAPGGFAPPRAASATA